MRLQRDLFSSGAFDYRLFDLKNHYRYHRHETPAVRLRGQWPFEERFPLTRLNTSLPNSFVMSVWKQEAMRMQRLDAEDYQFENLSVSSNYDKDNHSWNVAENPAFTVILDGYLYLTDSTTMDIKVNLARLLNEMSVTTIEKALQKIGGGMFNLVVVDKKWQRLIITCDRLGCMPLFFMEDSGGFHISGNQFAFKDATEVNTAASVEFLKYGFLPFSPSIFENVQRLLPGQILNVSLEYSDVRKSAVHVREFKPLAHRITSLKEASAALHGAYKRFADRMGEGQYAVQMDTGYESSLLAGWFRKKRPKLIELGETDENSTQLANLYNLELLKNKSATDKITLSMNGLAERSRIMTSLEALYPLWTQEVIQRHAPDFYLHTFMGDVVVGSSHFHALRASKNSLKRFVLEKEKLNRKIHKVSDYQYFLYNGLQALPDEELHGLVDKSREVWLLNGARGVLEINRNVGQVHEDFLEALQNYTLSRCLYAAEPVAFGRYMACICPFTDYDIVQTCYDIDKKIRAGDKLYNHYFRTYFPKLAKLRKAGFGGRPTDSDATYRLKRATRFVLDKAMTRLGSGEDEKYDKKELTRTVSELSGRIPGWILEKIEAAVHNETLDSRLMVRLISLSSYMESQPQSVIV